MRPKIRVKGCRWTALTVKNSPSRGRLLIAESGADLPFPIKRTYVMGWVPRRLAVRGNHAHKTLRQTFFCLKGSCRVELSDGRVTQSVRLNDPALGVLVPPKTWVIITDFSKDALVLAFASDKYRRSDYLRDRKAFDRLMGRK